MYPESLCNPL